MRRAARGGTAAFLRWIVLAALAMCLAGCETLAYYAQAVGGQMAMMARTEPVDKVIADPQAPAWLRERLVLARQIRDFAVKDLKLPDNGSYRGYADLDRPYAVWNVVAAPEFSLTPVQSCFPVAGCVAYRGFFSEARAREHADELRRTGHDVYYYGVVAYSTLGRLDDPVLSTFIRFPDAELARLLFHELAHQVAYAKDDSTFNESFAVAVEREGVKRWLAATGRSAELRAILEARERSALALKEMEAARQDLAALYRTRLAPEAMRERKAQILAGLKARLASNPRYAQLELNNAVLASFATYTALVPEFERMLAEEGGDLEKFYARVKKLAASVPSSRGPLSKPIP